MLPQADTKAAPLNRYISNHAEWKQLWNAWRPGEDVPQIDFTRHVVIVQHGGMYHVRFRFNVCSQGNLKISWHPLHTPTRGHGYGIAVIESKGIKTIEGSALKPDAPNSSEKTLLYYLSQSDLVVHGEIQSEPIRSSEEVGAVYYHCDFKVEAMIQGKQLPDNKLSVRITRFELEEEDRFPELRKLRKCILFLKNEGSMEMPRWSTADAWFSMQRYSPTMVRELKRLAK